MIPAIRADKVKSLCRKAFRFVKSGHLRTDQYCSLLFLIHKAGVEVNLGGMQQGQVVALYNYMAQMIVELIKLASLIITLNKSAACAGRVADIPESEIYYGLPLFLHIFCSDIEGPCNSNC